MKRPRGQGAPPLGRVRRELATLTPYSVPGSTPPIKLDANESPWPLPDEARQRLADELARLELHRYPDPRASALRDALATRTGAGPDELVLGCGSDELIALLLTVLTEPAPGQGRATVLTPEPTFAMYGITARAHGLEPVGVPLAPDWDLDVDAMKAAMATHRPSIVFLASPNNPTGRAYDESAVEAVIEAAGDALVVIDEAYGPFAGRSLDPLCDRWARVAILGTLSKAGLAGARVGWLRAHPDLAREVDKARQPFNLSSLAQRAAILALTDLAPVLDDHVRAIIRERERLHAELARLPGVTVAPSDANFLLVHLAGDAVATARELEDYGIAVRRFSGPPLTHHLRITVGRPEDDDRLLDALRTIVRGQPG